ncbi:MAG: sulfoxide reductase heme-binding subunit YedZ [Hylemonella sp.]|nr:sulfoxide reductase heme-binding subunit YedZ [Hylemonella sp.]MDH5708070.1 sulfoxide reductase heme-binding subunit YedZ [Hylemonella sp.]
MGLTPQGTRWLAAGWVKPTVGAMCLLPFSWLIWAAATDQLGANPSEALVRATGDWALRMLWLTLAVTPLRVLTGAVALARWRRMLGLFAYFYAVLHLLSYAWFDMGAVVPDIILDIGKRPFILVGFLTFCVLSLLALTSFNRAVRLLGGKRWQALHRLVYGAALMALLHFFWMRASKNGIAEVGVYALILSGLLGWRLWRHRAGLRYRAG